MPLMYSKPTTKNKIIHFLKYEQRWVSGTELESKSKAWQTKSSVISRRARELYNDGKIDRRLNIRKAVEYRYVG